MVWAEDGYLLSKWRWWFISAECFPSYMKLLPQSSSGRRNVWTFLSRIFAKLKNWPQNAFVKTRGDILHFPFLRLSCQNYLVLEQYQTAGGGRRKLIVSTIIIGQRISGLKQIYSCRKFKTGTKLYIEKIALQVIAAREQQTICAGSAHVVNLFQDLLSTTSSSGEWMLRQQH